MKRSMTYFRGIPGRAGLLLLALLAAGGCSMGMAGFDKAQRIVENECSSDGDCPGEGSFCDVENGICASRSGGIRSLLLEVVPRDSEGIPGQPSQYFVYEGEANRDIGSPLELCDYVEIKGVVKWSEEGGAYPDGMCDLDDDLDESGLCIVDAKVELVPTGEFPESERRTRTARTGEADSVRDGGSADDFMLKLVPGRYTLRVVPEEPFDSYLPPMQVYGDELIDGSRTLIIMYDGLSALDRVDGVIRRADGDVLRNISVWAVDPRRGERISSIARVDSDSRALPGGTVADPAVPGGYLESAFRLYLHSPASGLSGWSGEDFLIAISSNEESPNIPNMKFGEYDFEVLDLMDGDDGYVNMEAAGASYLMLPPVGVRVEYQATVEGVKPDGTIEPLEDVGVRFFTEDIGEESVSGTYEVYAKSNNEGAIFVPVEDETLETPVWLLPGDYTVTLYPPLVSPYESKKVTSVRISPQEGGVPQAGRAFQLAAKDGVAGWIVKEADGRALGVSTVEAYPVSSIGSTSAGSYVIPRFNSTQSDEEGMFALDLDSGLYDLLVIPDPNSNFPWTWMNNVEIGDAAVELTAAVPDPELLRGEVTGSRVPAAQAEIKIFEIVYSPIPEEPPATRHVGRTVTDAAGDFVVLISP